jgi:hypothetical protein
MIDLYRHKETGELFNCHELLSFSIRSNGPNFNPFFITQEIIDLLNVESVETIPFDQQLTKYQFQASMEVVQIDNRWIRRTVLGEHTTEEAKAEVDRIHNFDGRLQRDRLLAETDWTQLVDVPEATKAQYAAYRQQLRDITSVTGFPDACEWPTKPE